MPVYRRDLDRNSKRVVLFKVFDIRDWLAEQDVVFITLVNEWISMRPLRRKKTLHVTEDVRTGQDRVLGCESEENILSDEGSVDSVTVRKTTFLNCGCNAEPAGRCYECGAISCQNHHGICQKCQKPICMEHSVFVDVDNAETRRLCRRCAEKTSRQQIRKRIGRFCLSLFFVRTHKND